LPYSTPGAIPRQLKGFHNMAESLILEGRRERTFPRRVKPRPQRYAKNKNAVHS
ncbi:IS4 family transposase, partial [Vibrio splendidus]